MKIICRCVIVSSSIFAVDAVFRRKFEFPYFSYLAELEYWNQLIRKLLKMLKKKFPIELTEILHESTVQSSPHLIPKKTITWGIMVVFAQASSTMT